MLKVIYSKVWEWDNDANNFFFGTDPMYYYFSIIIGQVFLQLETNLNKTKKRTRADLCLLEGNKVIWIKAGLCYGLQETRKNSPFRRNVSQIFFAPFFILKY